MWISKKKWKALEKRVADLEKATQGQFNKAVLYDDFRSYLERWSKSKRTNFSE